MNRERSSPEIKTRIKDLAFSAGAQLCAVTRAESYLEYREEIRTRLTETRAEIQDYMVPGESFFDTLSDPGRSMSGVKSIILIGIYSYDQSAVYRNTRSALKGKTARIYSYYPVARQVADSVVHHIAKEGGKAVHGQHIPLKYLASHIGLGSYGKNAILQTREYGSNIALRNILTDLDLEPDVFQRKKSPCENCDKCLKACPTGALYAPYKVNPSLCLNPITRKEDYIEPSIRGKMQNWIVGCDICQEVCPSNRGLEPRQADPRTCFDPDHHDSHLLLGGLEQTPSLFELLDAGNPFQIRRNAAIALGNIGKSNDAALRALNEQLPNVSPELKEYFQWAIESMEA